MKKVAIIGTAGVPARYGGFETLVHQLVGKLNDQFKLYVYCSGKYYKKEERRKHWNGARLFYLPFNANGIQSIIYDMISIFHALLYADAMIVLGVSGGILIPFVKLFTNKNIIVNIDGLEWRREKWSKPVKKFLKLSEKLAVKYSDADITDNASIQQYTAVNYQTLSHLIEYGGDHASRVRLSKSIYTKYPFLRKPYAFKVCRIEPENNIHIILKAFSQLSDKTLVVVGNWNKSDYGIQLRKQYSTFENIHLLDPIYEQSELDTLRSNCYVYVHGHSAGGTNPSLVEAMFLELPVLAYDVSYNRATTEEEAFFFNNEKQLIHLLKTMKIEDYRSNSSKMKSIADRRYTWEEVAKKYANLILCFDYAYRKKPVFAEISGWEYEFLNTRGLSHLKRPVLFYEEL
ncbi:MAG: DUF1972 domain-containing protein [Chitinophagales bacterium]|nr:DUF1972 domain-containing protein [Chitinophagales bacterium]